MCGIIGYIGPKEGNPKDPKAVLIEGLKRLEYRGYDSAGIAIMEAPEVRVFRCEGRIGGLEDRLQETVFSGTVGIGHTRWATHGAPTENNAHPHRVGAITLVHNGIIENYRELRESLPGRAFQSETDSEIVAHLFDQQVQLGLTLKQAVLATLPRLRGSYAFVAMSTHEPDQLIGVRHGVPLLVGFGENENYLASDVQAILAHTQKVTYLQDGQIAVCTPSDVQISTLEGERVTPQVRTLQWTAEQAEKAGYRHYMLKEIHEQPQALAQTIEPHIDQNRGLVCLQGLDFAALGEVQRVVIVACGTARHAALVGQYYLEQFAGLGVDVDFGSEFRYRKRKCEPGTLLLLVSQSGETADTLAALKAVEGEEIPTLAICNVRDSSLGQLAGQTLYTHAGPEIGVAATKTFTTQLAMLYMLAVQLGHSRGHLSHERAQELTQDLLHLPVLMEAAIERSQSLEQIAVSQLETSFFFFMGRNVHYPIALEGALKLKEISYAHAEGYPAGELKHGPIALIDRHTVVWVLAPWPEDCSDSDLNAVQKSLHDKTLSNLQEVKARGALIVVIGNASIEDAHESLILPRSSWALSPILFTVPLQFFAYFMALHRGADVDKPRNLAKSVTVE